MRLDLSSVGAIKTHVLQWSSFMKPFQSSHLKNKVKNVVNFLPLMFKLGLNVTKLRCEKPIEIKMFELWTSGCNMLKSIISYHQTYAQLQTRNFGTSWDWLKPYINQEAKVMHWR